MPQSTLLGVVLLGAVGSLALALSAGAQSRAFSDWVVTERGPHHSVHERTEIIELPGGRTETHTRRFVELASGLNRIESGQWVPARAEFEILSGGYAHCRQTQQWSDVEMKYWGTNAIAHATLPDAFVTTAALVRHADGQCGAWREFMWDSLGLHGVVSTKVKITLTNVYPPLLTSPVGMRMRTDLHGQGNMAPPRDFEDHAIINHAGIFYDPSYGQEHPVPIDWEDASLDQLLYDDFAQPLTKADPKGTLDNQFE